jgi:hypothetical protein
MSKNSKAYAKKTDSVVSATTLPLRTCRNVLTDPETAPLPVSPTAENGAKSVLCRKGKKEIYCTT